jgi:hypothetical protein
VSSFWLGAASSLIGAIVGGLFTAWGARIQASAASKSMLDQVRLARESELDLLRRTRSHDAMFDLAVAANKLVDNLFRISGRHDEAQVVGRPHVRPKNADVKRLVECTLEFYRLIDICIAHVPRNCHAWLAELQDVCASTESGWLDATDAVHRKFCCEYARDLDELTNDLRDLFHWLRYARTAVVSEGKEDRIFVDHPELWLLEKYGRSTDEEARQKILDKIARRDWAVVMLNDPQAFARMVDQFKNR